MHSFLFMIFCLIATDGAAFDPYYFDQNDRTFLSSLSVKNLEPVAIQDFGAEQAVADFGKKLFFDTRLSGNGKISCGTCHIPENYFTDGLPQAIGMGLATRNTPSVLVAKYSPWQSWDGHKDSLWSQALGPLESPSEHGTNRKDVVQVIQRHYRGTYTNIFGPIRNSTNGINQAFANVGKALMAYQFQLNLEFSRFDRFVEALLQNKLTNAKKIFSEQEVKGLRLFAGKGNCISCHNGPLFTNFEFHNTGIPPRDQQQVDLGRFGGVKRLKDDEFTCLSSYSGIKKDACLEMKYLKTSGPELVGAFKTPSLRNIEKTSPYMHAGQFATLEEVLDHYNKPKPPFYDREQHPNRPHFDIMPLQLSDEEKAQIIAFLKTLTSPLPKA